MRDTATELMRALVTAQVAVLEDDGREVGDETSMDVLDECLREAKKLARKLRKEGE